MARKSNKSLTANLKGWEKKYIQNSIKYGHLDKSKKSYKRGR